MANFLTHYNKNTYASTENFVKSSSLHILPCCDYKIVLILLITVLFVFSCARQKPDNSEKSNSSIPATNNASVSLKSAQFVIDAEARKVPVPANLDGGIVTIGSSGPLRFLSIFDVYDSIVQVDKGDVTDSKHGRAYSYAFSYDSFDASKYHPDNNLEGETLERIGQRKPSLIVVQSSVYKNFTENCELLASQFPLVVIPEQSMVELWDDDYRIAKWYVDTVEILGTMLGQSERANIHIQKVNEILADIRTLVPQDMQTHAKYSAIYVAGLTWQGSNELTTTFPLYLPLQLVSGVNAYSSTSTGRVVLDPEQVTTMPIDCVIIDPSSVDKLATPNSQLVLQWLYERALLASSDPIPRVFVSIPMVWDSANYDCVLAGAYYLAHLLYGSISEEQLEQRIFSVFEAYYGNNAAKVMPGMRTFFSHKAKANRSDISLLKEAKVVRVDNYYTIMGQ